MMDFLEVIMKNNVLNLGLRKQVDDCKPYIAGETEAAVLKNMD